MPAGRFFASVQEVFDYLWPTYAGSCGRRHRWDPDVVVCAACLDADFEKLERWLSRP